MGVMDRAYSLSSYRFPIVYVNFFKKFRGFKLYETENAV